MGRQTEAAETEEELTGTDASLGLLPPPDGRPASLELLQSDLTGPRCPAHGPPPRGRPRVSFSFNIRKQDVSPSRHVALYWDGGQQAVSQLRSAGFQLSPDSHPSAPLMKDSWTPASPTHRSSPVTEPPPSSLRLRGLLTLRVGFFGSDAAGPSQVSLR